MEFRPLHGVIRTPSPKYQIKWHIKGFLCNMRLTLSLEEHDMYFIAINNDKRLYTIASDELANCLCALTL